MLLHELDFKALLLLRHLLDSGSVSRAAEALGLSQPAASNALARLRRHFDDPLFIRTPAGMAPTPRAQALAEPVRQALALLEGALATRPAFAPQASERTFRIGMTDIGEVYFLPALMDRLARAAPQVAISTVQDGALPLKDALASGQLDLAIGLLPQLQAGFHQRRLFSQRYVCLFRRGHALDQGRITPAAYAGAEHVEIVAAGTGHGQLAESLARAGLQRRIRLTVPHFVAVGHILARTDLVATVPEKLAQSLAEPFGLVHLPHPARLPPFDVHVFWHTRVHQDPASRWLRQLVVDTFAQARA